MEEERIKESNVQEKKDDSVSMQWMEAFPSNGQKENEQSQQFINEYSYIGTSKMIAFQRDGAGTIMITNHGDSKANLMLEKVIYHNYTEAVLSVEVFHNVEIPEDMSVSENYAPMDLSNYPQEPFGKLESHENLAYHKDYCFLSSTLRGYQSIEDPMLTHMILPPGTNLAFVFHVVNSQPQAILSLTAHWTEVTSQEASEF